MPVIASDLPGLADLIQPTTAGYSTAPESREKLAAALKQVVSDPT